MELLCAGLIPQVGSSAPALGVQTSADACCALDGPQGAAHRRRVHGPQAGADGDDGGHADILAGRRLLRARRARMDWVDQVLQFHLLGQQPADEDRIWQPYAH